MDVKEIIRRYRVDANDMVEPYFVADIVLMDWINDAIDEACVRGRLIFDAHSPNVCHIAVTSGLALYPLHQSVYEVCKAWFDPADGQLGRMLTQVSPFTLDKTYYENWRDMRGMPQYFIQTDTTVQLVPQPDVDGTVKMDVYRLPILPLETDDGIPEIHRAHHVHLIQWLLYKGFSIPDSEFFDPQRAELAKQNFEDYFGIRPDSDLQRIVNQDRPHGVEPFWP